MTNRLANEMPDLTAPDAPKFWLFEMSGRLYDVVLRYLENGKVTPDDVRMIGAYFAQWADSPVWDMNPAINDEGREALQALRASASRIATQRDIDKWWAAAVALGMDPL
jgi:hypothetical protein